jgi:hypothetical protein
MSNSRKQQAANSKHSLSALLRSDCCLLGLLFGFEE